MYGHIFEWQFEFFNGNLTLVRADTKMLLRSSKNARKIVNAYTVLKLNILHIIPIEQIS